MADLEKTVSIIFSGVDKSAGVISGVSKNIDQFAGKLEDASQPLADMFDALVKVDTILAAMAAGSLVVAVNEAGKFSDSFKEISTLTNASSDDLNQFRDDIITYARDSTASIDDINASIYTAISAGTSYKDSLDLLSTSEKLSIAGRANLESTTKVLVSSLNAYGESTDKAEEYSDALFKTVKLGQTTLPELSQSLSLVSTTAANSGVKFDELMAAIAAVTATGAPTSQAITAIKAAISAIVKPSSEAAKEAKALGIQFNAAALETKGLDGVLKDVYSATGGATDQITKLFGSVESLPAVMTLGKDASGNFAKALDEFKNKAGATSEAYEKMADNFGLTNQRLANNVKATFIQVGSELLGGYTDIANSITEIFKSVGVSIDAGAFDEVFAALNEFGDGVSKFFNELAATLPEALNKIDWTKFIDALKDLGGSFGGLFDGFDPKDPDDVAKAIQFVVNSFESLIRVSTGMVEAVKPVVKIIIDWVEEFNKLDASTKKNIGEVTGWGKVVNTLAGLISPVTTAIEGMSKAILVLSGVNAGKVLLDIGKGAPALTSTLQKVVGSGAGKAGLLGIAAAAGYTAGTLINEYVPGVKSSANAITDWIFKQSEHQKKLDEADAKYKEAVEQAKITRAALESVEEASPDIYAETGQFFENLGKVNKAVDEFEYQEAIKKLYINTEDASYNLAQLDKQLEELGVKSSGLSVGMDDGAFDGIKDFISDIESELENNPVPIPTKPDKKAIEDTKKKIKQEFSQASVGDINIGFKIGENGVGGIGDGIRDEISKMEPVDIGEIMDLGGLSDLIDSAKGLENYSDRQQAVDQAFKIANAQQRIMDAEAANLRIRNAILEQESRNIDRLSGDYESTIKIEASGLEPEMEAFMWKLLKKIQVRANQAGAEFLLAAT